jgi:hypothetical protein
VGVFSQLLLFIVTVTSISGCFGARTLQEKDYQRSWCTKHKGELEHRLSDGTRVDCLTSEYAVEVEYAHKWAEAIGQSLYYAKMTGRKPGIVLIKSEKGDERFARRLREVATGEKIKVWTIRPDNVR